MLEQSLNYCDKIAKLVKGLDPLKVAEVGKPVVEKWYATADADETHDYIVGAEPNGKGACLIVHGDDVVFREFGAGVLTYPNPFPNAQGLPTIADGSWSATEGTGEYAKYGSWHHKKQKYVGVAPTLGMYNASRVMRDFVAQYVKEVMK